MPASRIVGQLRGLILTSGTDPAMAGLLLNAGVWPMEKRVTADGLEEGLQVCHVSHQMLAQALRLVTHPSRLALPECGVERDQQGREMYH